jgi:hypothetical protein
VFSTIYSAEWFWLGEPAAGFINKVMPVRFETPKRYRFLAAFRFCFASIAASAVFNCLRTDFGKRRLASSLSEIFVTLRFAISLFSGRRH